MLLFSQKFNLMRNERQWLQQSLDSASDLRDDKHKVVNGSNSMEMGALEWRLFEAECKVKEVRNLVRLKYYCGKPK